MNIWRRPFVAFIGAFCSAMGINALSNATDLLAGRFQASLSEISPATSLYLIAEIAALPLMPMIVARLGAARLLKIALWGFLVGSVLCLLAPSLDLLLAGRVVQGFFGGLLVTTPLLIMRTDLPTDKQPFAMAGAGFVAGFAPIIGPLLTATLTANTVQLIFLVMSLMIVAGLFILPSDKETLKNNEEEAHKNLPISNVMAVLFFSAGLASVVWAVEHSHEWGAWSDYRFRLHLLLGFAVITLAGLHQWKRDAALLPLVMLIKPRYIGILLSSVMMGVVVYGFLYLVPYYLIRVHGAGVKELFNVTLYASIPQLIWLPVVLFLRNKLSPYLLVMFGSLLGTFSVWQMTGLGLDFGGSSWILPQGLRAMSIPMIALPLGLLLIKLPSKEDAPALTSLYSLCRTLGAIAGVSGLSAYIESQQSYYVQIIMMNPLSENVMPHNIERSGWLYAFNDAFLVVAVAMMIMSLYFGWMAWRQRNTPEEN